MMENNQARDAPHENNRDTDTSRRASIVLDLDREGFRLETYQTYAIVSSILMGSALGMITLVDFGNDDSSSQQCELNESLMVYLKHAVVITGSLSVVFAAYSTMVFNFTNAYLKTALGLGRQRGYQAFLDKTAIYRQRGFFASWHALHLFLICFVLWLFLLLKGMWRWIVSVLIGVLVALVSRDFHDIANLASEHVFLSQ